MNARRLASLAPLGLLIILACGDSDPLVQGSEDAGPGDAEAGAPADAGCTTCDAGPHPIAPTAVADELGGFTTVAGNVLANDTAGTPAAKVVSFGGGDLGANTTTAGTSVALGGGMLNIGADGALSLTGAARGTYELDYRIGNSAGESQAHVTLAVRAAVADGFTTADEATLSANVTSNDDMTGTPAPTVATFGGGTLGGMPSTNTAGPTAVAVAQGSVTLAPSGALTFVPAAGFVGLFTFSYVLAQAAAQSTAEVRIVVGGTGSIAFDMNVGQNPPLNGHITSLQSFGNDFDVVEPITVTELGAFDSGQDGLAGAVEVKLYNRDTEALVTNATIVAGTAARLLGTHRFVPLTTRAVLPAGFKGTIVWESSNNQFYRPDVSPGAATNNNLSRDSGNGTLSFTGLAARTGVFGAYPTTPAPLAGAAASFRYVRTTPAAAVAPDAAITNAVPEANQYRVVYDLAIPAMANYGTNFNLGSAQVGYTRNDSASVTRPFDRIAYYMLLDADWVWVSMDAFSRDAGRIAMPVWGSGGFFQRSVANATVASNVGGIVVGTGIAAVNLEFWPSNYGSANTRAAAFGGPVAGASDATYDLGDGASSLAAGYGCMQIHNPGAAQTLFAYNRWASAGTNGDIGIGNQIAPATNPDWTFASNAANFATRRLLVLVREVAP